MAEELDLKFLTPEEVNQIRSVLNRAKKVEDNHKVKSTLKEDTSNVLLRMKQKDNAESGELPETYVTACEVVSAALSDNQSDISKSKDITNSNKFLSIDYNIASQPQYSMLNGMKGAPSIVSIRIVTDESTDFSDSSSSSSNLTKNDMVQLPRYLDPAKRHLAVRKSQTLPLNAYKTDSDAITCVNSIDSRSMISRQSLTAKESAGTIEISLTYYQPCQVKQRTFPKKGTRFADNNKLDVLTRKTYAASSGVKIGITKERKSGARSDKDGELHLFVNGANDLVLPSGMNDKMKTYVKCYLLPDRNHGSKMKSEVQTDTLDPRYKHLFIFRGFSEEEFNQRSIEVVVGGIVSGHGRNFVVGCVRLSDGKVDHKNPVTWKDRNLDETNLWTRAFQQPSTEVSALLHLRPNIKLTYK